ncbi:MULTISPECIES: Rieske 2Fe-2S domain-containing protein [unclassified Variovorax]|uniref:Rieske 2Fe-2S domain-containing protein n=1 Tax=unclassified Variovorax TaxID=663243 RepID=UPI0008D67FCB|nr:MULTISPECIES: Rieske 2Fe-2S domain-containing protein [unclassified Variovorax]SEJ27209.1 Rieske [2Fe-2S] domain-containing protein [Variovorax sp. OK202]SFC20313.1 Rieske [2Fe-2S] domain-containing protein [Variovorax sp. OK212]
MNDTQDTATWHPVAPSAGLRPGANIVAGFAEGQELALWRAADGTAQAWENRCPHRSVRFTLGQVIDNRLACAYHGWEYAAGSGQCTRIPAHPAMQAPRNVCAKTFATAEAAGMLWVRLSPEMPSASPAPTSPPAPPAPPAPLAPPAPPALAGAVPANWHFCRTLTVRAPAATVRETLARRGLAAGEATGAWRGPLDGVDTAALVLDAQPRLAFVHLWAGAAPGSAAMQALHTAARSLRGDIEALG